VGGLAKQIQEVKEAVELPLTHPELYEDIGIKPPKGVIFYGPPGTGKTLLAKAVANETSATFLRVVGSELIQKYLGDGPKLVRELFRVADENAPSIVFIDEIDAVGTKRYGRTYTHTRTHHQLSRLRTHTHTQTHAQTASSRTYEDTHARTHTQTHTHTHTHAQTHIHTHTHTHTYTFSFQVRFDLRR
jgi:SpoVK/Ycf46/Vps4 family AAA+-type ATPase